MNSHLVVQRHRVQFLFSAGWHVAQRLHGHFVLFPVVFDGCSQVECFHQARVLARSETDVTGTQENRQLDQCQKFGSRKMVDRSIVRCSARCNAAFWDVLSSFRLHGDTVSVFSERSLKSREG